MWNANRENRKAIDFERGVCAVMARELTDEEIAREEKFLKGIPRVNIGALFLPPIWGPAHGMWAAILFYPIWLFADNTFYAAFSAPSVLSVVFAVVVFVLLTAATVAFSIVSQPFAAHRAAEHGVSREKYRSRQRAWAVASVVVGCVMIAAATYYNLAIRPGLGA